MRYLLLIHTPEADEEAMSPTEMETYMAGYFRFGEEAGKAGALLGGERLRPVATATTVRVKDGKVTTTDGPFCETKEQFGGFYMVEAKDLDEAVAWAAKIPGASHGCVEVRPIWEMDGEG